MRFRQFRQQCLWAMPLPFLYFAYRYVSDGGRLGYFMCSETAQLIFAGIYCGFYAVLAITVVFEMIFFTKKEPGWMGVAWRVKVEDYIRVLPIPKSLWPAAFANLAGLVVIYLLSVVGCWLRS